MRLNAARLDTATFIITQIRTAAKAIPAPIVGTRSAPSVVTNQSRGVHGFAHSGYFGNCPRQISQPIVCRSVK